LPAGPTIEEIWEEISLEPIFLFKIQDMEISGYGESTYSHLEGMTFALLLFSSSIIPKSETNISTKRTNCENPHGHQVCGGHS